MDPAAGVPEPSCPAAWPPAVPFLWSRGVWAGVPSRSFMVLWRKRFRKKGEEILETGLLIQPGCFYRMVRGLKIEA